MFETVVYKWLDSALDYGITERCYWDMTLAEAIRAIESRKRQRKQQAQEKAANDYILADLIGRSISRLYSSSGSYPPIYDVYPSLFDGEEIEAQQQQKKDELSILRFKQFAQAFNNKFEGVSSSE